MRAQRGGFVVGLIVGLLVGLGLALAVALYVTKAPVPFINKVQQRTPGDDRAADDAARQPDADQVALGRALRGQQGTLPALLHVDLPAGEAGADVIAPTGDDQALRAVVSRPHDRQQHVGRRHQRHRPPELRARMLALRASAAGWAISASGSTTTTPAPA